MNNKGHTLLECTIATSILVVVLLGGMAAFCRTQLLSQVVQHNALAMKACQEVMEQLSVMSISDLPAQNGLKFDFTAVPLKDPNIGLITVTTLQTSAKSTIYEIKVSITHGGEEYGPFKAELTSRRSKT